LTGTRPGACNAGTPVNNSTLILGAFAAAFAAASIYLGMHLGDAREQLAAADQARVTDQARIRQLETEVQGLEAMFASIEESAPPPAHQPPVALGGERAKSDAPPQPGAAPSLPAPRRATAAPSEAEQANRRLQQEIRLRRRYAEMPGALGLDDAQADKLFDLLSEYRIAEYESGRPYQGDRLGRESVENDTRRQRDAAIESLLGPDKAAEFQAFEKSIPARMQVNRIGEGMAAANVPLSEAQRKSLVNVVMAEQEAFPPPERPADGTPDPDFDTRFFDWQMDYSRRVQARVEPLLSGEQARQYRQAVQAQNARRAEMRARAEARRNGDGR
jgi:hypothetical protein